MRRVAQLARSKLDALMEFPGMREALGKAGVRFMGELTPEQPKIVQKLTQDMREISALRNGFRNRHEFFPDQAFRQRLKRDLTEAKGLGGDGDHFDRLTAQQNDVNEIEVLEKKADLLNRANYMINQAWNSSVRQMAQEMPGDPAELVYQWGAGARLAVHAEEAMQLAGINNLGITPMPTPGLDR